MKNLLKTLALTAMVIVPTITFAAEKKQEPTQAVSPVVTTACNRANQLQGTWTAQECSNKFTLKISGDKFSFSEIEGTYTGTLVQTDAHTALFSIRKGTQTTTYKANISTNGIELLDLDFSKTK